MNTNTIPLQKIGLFLSVLCLLFGFNSQLNAQGFQVSGKVLTAQSKEPLPGVNILEIGTQNGVATDTDGTFSLTVSDENAQLKVSFIGYETQTVAVDGQSNLTILLKESVGQLKDLVVTAFGIEKEQRSVGYSIGEVNTESLAKNHSTNVADNLSGKVAGVQVSNPQTGPAGASRVVIRGVSSLNGNNEPLIVVDGVPIDNRTIGSAGLYGGFSGGNALNSINPEDIKSMSVLKGPSAAALYGSRAQNGAIVITTKSGRTGQNAQVTLKSSVTFSKILTDYDFQQEYGLGSRGNAPATQQAALINGASSWGAKINGQQVVGFDGVERPYTAHPDNLQHYYQTGSDINNTLAFSGGDENSSFYLSFTNLNNQGIIPTTTLDKKNINFHGNRTFGNFKAEAKANYIIQKTTFRPQLSDNPANPALSLSYMPTTLDVRLLKDYQTADGSHIPWNNNVFRPNPYWGIHKASNNDTKRRLIGFVKLNYTPVNWLNIQGRVGTDFYTLRRQDFTSSGSPWLLEGQLSEDEYRVREDNINLLATINHQLTRDLSLTANVGANRRYQRYEDINQYGRNFIIPNLIDITNTDATQQSNGHDFNEKEVNSIFGSAQFSYRDYLFLELTARNDWSSTLPKSNDSYFYPSVNAGFVFTDALNIQSNVLSFGKIRASVAEVGSDTDPYSLNLSYGVFGSHPSVNGSTVPFGGINNGTIPLQDLKPSSTKSYEVGLNLGLFSSRANVDFTYYRQNTSDQILGTTISQTSGYGSQTINAGEISNKGVEASVSGYPVQNQNFSWNIGVNFAKNINTVESLSAGKTTLQLAQSRSLITYIEAQVGESYNQIVGTAFVRNKKGQIVYDDDGFPLTQNNQVIGNGTPDWTGGITNEFSYKNFSLSALIDIQAGGDIYSLTNAQAYATGRQKATLKGRESFYNDPDNGGIIGQGVKMDSTTANNVAVDPQVYFGRLSTDVAEPFVYDASFIKLRQLTFTYSLPKIWLNKIPISDAEISLVGRNLITFLKNTPNIDPESNYQTGNAQGLEHATLPSTRTFGFDITLKF